MPVAIAPVDRQLRAVLREFVLESGDQFAGLLVDGAFATEMVVVLGDGQHTFARNVSAAQYVFEEGDDIVLGFRAAEGDNENRVVIHELRMTGGHLAKKFAAGRRKRSFGGVSFRENSALGGGPPSPTPSERLDGRGLCKKCLQNLDLQGVSGQNPDNRRLGAFSEGYPSIASALTMILLLLV